MCFIDIKIDAKAFVDFFGLSDFKRSLYCKVNFYFDTEKNFK